MDEPPPSRRGAGLAAGVLPLLFALGGAPLFAATEYLLDLSWWFVVPIGLSLLGVAWLWKRVKKADDVTRRGRGGAGGRGHTVDG